MFNKSNIKLLSYSFIQSIYIIYILNFFKTRYSFAHPFFNFSLDYFKHPIGINKIPILNVCKFGQDASWFLVIFLIVRSLFVNKYTKKISIFVLIITILLSLLNFNVVIYLIPYFIIEIFLITCEL